MTTRVQHTNEKRLQESQQQAEEADPDFRAVDDAVVIPTETPPDGGYGWVVCGAISAMNGFTWGIAAVRIPPR